MAKHGRRSRFLNSGFAIISHCRRKLLNKQGKLPKPVGKSVSDFLKSVRMKDNDEIFASYKDMIYAVKDYKKKR